LSCLKHVTVRVFVDQVSAAWSKPESHQGTGGESNQAEATLCVVLCRQGFSLRVLLPDEAALAVKTLADGSALEFNSAREPSNVALDAPVVLAVTPANDVSVGVSLEGDAFIRSSDPCNASRSVSRDGDFGLAVAQGSEAPIKSTSECHFQSRSSGSSQVLSAEPLKLQGSDRVWKAECVSANLEFVGAAVDLSDAPVEIALKEQFGLILKAQTPKEASVPENAPLSATRRTNACGLT
jgi:hypothetical protein